MIRREQQAAHSAAALATIGTYQAVAAAWSGKPDQLKKHLKTLTH